MLKEAYKQAAKTIFGKPLVLIAVMASIISGPILEASAGNLVVCLQQRFGERS